MNKKHTDIHKQNYYWTNNMIPNQNITPHSATLHETFGNPDIKGLSLEFKLTRSLETYEAVTRPQSHLTASIVNRPKTS